LKIQIKAAQAAFIFMCPASFFFPARSCSRLAFLHLLFGIQLVAGICRPLTTVRIFSRQYWDYIDDIDKDKLSGGHPVCWRLFNLASNGTSL
jgi:hypothetical protein